MYHISEFDSEEVAVFGRRVVWASGNAVFLVLGGPGGVTQVCRCTGGVQAVKQGGGWVWYLLDEWVNIVVGLK